MCYCPCFEIWVLLGLGYFQVVIVLCLRFGGLKNMQMDGLEYVLFFEGLVFLLLAINTCFKNIHRLLLLFSYVSIAIFFFWKIIPDSFLISVIVIINVVFFVLFCFKNKLRYFISVEERQQERNMHCD